jgi:hypothetical protein
MRWLILTMFALALLTGCGDRKPPEKTVFDPQIQAIKKARQVEQKVLDAAQQQRDNVERQEAGQK